MTNTQIVRIDLTSPGGFAPVIHAVAGDIYSRFVRMELYQGGVLYEPPSGTTCVIGWRRGETYGAYSSILEEDGSSSHPAWELEDNVLTIELDWHVCQHPGDVAVNVSLNGEGGSRLHTWELCCRVARGAVADADDPTKPSESASEAADRAEAAAADAEAAAERSEAVADELENIVKDGPVVSVNGKTGRVQLSASDIPFDNAGTPFVSTTVQDAIEELLDIGGGGGTASSTITVTAPAGSVVTVSKGDKSYTQTVGEDGAALSFKVLETGEWTVSGVVNGRVYKRTVNVAEAGGSYSVELAYIQDVQGVLDDNSWEMIKRVADADEGANWWSVGDTKSIMLSGTVGILSVNSLTIDTFILGFNHNSSKEGEHRIHFAIGKISGNQVALCDNQYDNYTSSICFHMNSSDDNGGGWNQSYMRKTILGNSGSTSSPPSNSLLAALPADLRAVMQSVNKYTDNTGHGSNSSGEVTATVDWLWLLAEFELYGSRKYANQYERNSQQQYDYFKAGNPKTFGKHNATGTVVWAWSRSPSYLGNYRFVFFNTDGTAPGNYAYYSGGLFAGFAV